MALVDNVLVNSVVNQYGCNGLIGGRQLFGYHHDVWFDIKGLATEHIAGSTETADDLVRDNQDVMLAAHLLDLFPVGLRRNDHTPRSHQRLAIKRCDRLRAFLDDQIIQFSGEAICELFFCFTRSTISVKVRAADMQEARQGNVKTALICRQPSEARTYGSGNVICVLPTDELFLGGLPQSIVPVP